MLIIQYHSPWNIGLRTYLGANRMYRDYPADGTVWGLALQYGTTWKVGYKYLSGTTDPDDLVLPKYLNVDSQILYLSYPF